MGRSESLLKSSARAASKGLEEATVSPNLPLPEGLSDTLKVSMLSSSFSTMWKLNSGTPFYQSIHHSISFFFYMIMCLSISVVIVHLCMYQSYRCHMLVQLHLFCLQFCTFTYPLEMLKMRCFLIKC